MISLIFKFEKSKNKEELEKAIDNLVEYLKNENIIDKREFLYWIKILKKFDRNIEFDIEEISDITGLSIEDVLELKKKLN